MSTRPGFKSVLLRLQSSCRARIGTTSWTSCGSWWTWCASSSPSTTSSSSTGTTPQPPLIPWDIPAFLWILFLFLLLDTLFCTPCVLLSLRHEVPKPNLFCKSFCPNWRQDKKVRIGKSCWPNQQQDKKVQICKSFGPNWRQDLSYQKVLVFYHLFSQIRARLYSSPDLHKYCRLHIFLIFGTAQKFCPNWQQDWSYKEVLIGKSFWQNRRKEEKRKIIKRC